MSKHLLQNRLEKSFFFLLHFSAVAGNTNAILNVASISITFVQPFVITVCRAVNINAINRATEASVCRVIDHPSMNSIVNVEPMLFIHRYHVELKSQPVISRARACNPVIIQFSTIAIRVIVRLVWHSLPDTVTASTNNV